MKRRFLQHLENTPEIKFECQEDKQYPIFWSFISKYFKFVPSSFLEIFAVTKAEVKLTAIVGPTMWADKS